LGFTTTETAVSETKAKLIVRFLPQRELPLPVTLARVNTLRDFGINEQVPTCAMKRS